MRRKEEALRLHELEEEERRASASRGDGDDDDDDDTATTTTTTTTTTSTTTTLSPSTTPPPSEAEGKQIIVAGWDGYRITMLTLAVLTLVVPVAFMVGLREYRESCGACFRTTALIGQQSRALLSGVMSVCPLRKGPAAEEFEEISMGELVAAGADNIYNPPPPPCVNTSSGTPRTVSLATLADLDELDEGSGGGEGGGSGEGGEQQRG